MRAPSGMTPTLTRFHEGGSGGERRCTRAGSASSSPPHRSARCSGTCVRCHRRAGPGLPRRHGGQGGVPAEQGKDVPLGVGQRGGPCRRSHPPDVLRRVGLPGGGRLPCCSTRQGNRSHDPGSRSPRRGSSAVHPALGQGSAPSGRRACALSGYGHVEGHVSRAGGIPEAHPFPLACAAASVLMVVRDEFSGVSRIRNVRPPMNYPSAINRTGRN